MSEERPTSNVQLSTSTAASGPSAQLLAVAERYQQSGMTVVVDEEILRRIHDSMDAAVRAGEEVVALIREAAGAEPGPISAHLVTMMQMGTGFHRTGRDTLRKLFTARNAARRACKKPEDRE